MKREVREQTERVERTETLSAEIMGFDVILSRNAHRSELSICRLGESPIYVGILRINPKNIAELEKFAEVASDLLREVAKQLRESGEDDFRSEWEKRSDEMKVAFMKHAEEFGSKGERAS